MDSTLLARLALITNAPGELRSLFQAVAHELIPLFQPQRIVLSLLTGRGLALDAASPQLLIDLPRERLPESFRRHSHPFPISEPTEADWLSAQRCRAALVLPLIIQDRLLGMLTLGAADSARMEGWDLAGLEIVSRLLALALDHRLALAEVAALQSKREQENVLLRTVLEPSQAVARLRNCPGLDGVCRAIELVAAADSTVLITGETGTGKELVAQAIHDLSPRRDQVLVKVNCAALPRELIAAELFGHEPGAFTGALKRRVGRFELAHQGTLFLDEIAEISAETQVLLLRVLQERVIERIGGTEAVPVDVRVITATNRELATAVQAGTFRADLFYRLNVFPIRLPPLRERRDDLPRLIEHFLTRFNERLHKNVRRVAPSTLNRLLAYHWPGNVRELENIIERALIMVSGDTLAIDPDWLLEPSPTADAAVSLWSVRERQTILEALKRSGGKVYGAGGAAELLGLKPTTLYGKMRKLGIRRSDDEE